MKLLLQNKHIIVSLGLLPVILMMVFIHLFPSTPTLFVTLLISLCIQAYEVLKLRSFNLFLFHGMVAMAVCILVRSFTGFWLIPNGYLVLSIEVLMLLCSFGHLVFPHYYEAFLRKHALRAEVNYRLEAKVIVVLVSFHLLCLLLIFRLFSPFPEHFAHFLRCTSAILVFLLCLLFNIMGVRLLLREVQKAPVIRVAPICNNKVFLTPREVSVEGKIVKEWDLPIESMYLIRNMSVEDYVKRITRNFVPAHIEPRFSLKHYGCMRLKCCQTICLYLLPLTEEADLQGLEGDFFSLDTNLEDESEGHRYSCTLKEEFPYLRMAGELWQNYK